MCRFSLLRSAMKFWFLSGRREGVNNKPLHGLSRIGASNFNVLLAGTKGLVGLLENRNQQPSLLPK